MLFNVMCIKSGSPLLIINILSIHPEQQWITTLFDSWIRFERVDIFSKSEDCSVNTKCFSKEPFEMNGNSLLVQIWRAAGGTLEVFTYFSILWNCVRILECWSTWCSYLVSEVWSHYKDEADYWVVITNSTAIPHWWTCKSGWNDLKSTKSFKEDL